MPVNEVTTNANEYIYYTPAYIPTGEYTFSDAAGWTYDRNYRNYRLTPEAFDELIDRISRVHPIAYYDEAESAVTCSTAKVQEEEEFDTTEIEKYIDSLEKEVVGTEN